MKGPAVRVQINTAQHFRARAPCYLTDQGYLSFKPFSPLKFEQVHQNIIIIICIVVVVREVLGKKVEKQEEL